MKKLLVLLTVVTLVTSTTGCGIGRRIRDRICRGAYCGSTATVAPTVVPAPAPVMVAPQAAAPVMYGVPCQTCYPCDPCCSPCGDACCGESAVYDNGWQASDCGCTGGGSYYEGAIPSASVPTTAAPATTFSDPSPLP